MAKNLAIVQGNHFQFFCPKRFNRYPRFTIFFKKDPEQKAASNVPEENIVSLSPQFLQYLMDKRADTEEGSPKAEAEKTEGVTSWNQKKEAVQAFDPFDKVVLVKNIDNSILTSFRTLKRENNTVSETYKVVHRKFRPTRIDPNTERGNKNKSIYHGISDNEEAVTLAQAQLLADDAYVFIEEEEPSSIEKPPRLQSDDVTLSKKQTEDLHVNIGRDLDDLHFTNEEYRESGQEFSSNMTKDMPTRIGFPAGPVTDVAKRDDNTGRSIAQSSTGQELKPMGTNVFQFDGVGQDPGKHFYTHDSMKPRQSGAMRRSKAYIKTTQKVEQRQPPTPTTRKEEKPGFQNAALASEPFTINVGLDDTALKHVEKKDTKMLESLTAVSGQRHVHLVEKSPYEVIHLAKIDPLESLPEKTIKIEVKKTVGDRSKDVGQFEALQTTLPKTQKIHSVQADRSSPHPPALNVTQKRSNQLRDSSFDGSSQAALNISSHIKTIGNAPVTQTRGDHTATYDVPDYQAMMSEPEKSQLSQPTEEHYRRTPGIPSSAANASTLAADGVRNKYGADFTIPELPPVLKEHLFPQVKVAKGGRDLPPEFSNNALQQDQAFSTNRPYRIKKFIDEIYERQAKQRYQKQYVREDYLSATSTIFDLSKAHGLRPNLDYKHTSDKLADGAGYAEADAKLMPDVQYLNIQ